MKYLLQIYSDAAEFERLSAHEQEAIVGEYLAVRKSPGVIDAEQLQPVETATTVRVEDGETLLTDGSFVDAKDHLGVGPDPDVSLREGVSCRDRRASGIDQVALAQADQPCTPAADRQSLPGNRCAASRSATTLPRAYRWVSD